MGHQIDIVTGGRSGLKTPIVSSVPLVNRQLCLRCPWWTAVADRSCGMDAECSEGVTKKKNRNGRSGWIAYNAKRAKTGVRSDYVRKRPAARIETAVAVAVSTGNASAVVVSEGALVAIPQVHATEGTLVAASEASAVAAVAAGSPSSSAETARAPETSALAETKTYRSIGVGEHSTGEPILWRGIFDMP